MTPSRSWARKNQAAVRQPEPVPLSGVYCASDYLDDVKNIYANGHGRGASTGFDSIDELFTIAEGQLSIVTGMPSSGKSEFIDQIMINLAQRDGWKFAVCSFENPPAMTLPSSQKITSKPFYSGIRERMSEDELSDAMSFIEDHFMFLSQDAISAPLIQSSTGQSRRSCAVLMAC